MYMLEPSSTALYFYADVYVNPTVKQVPHIESGAYAGRGGGVQTPPPLPFGSENFFVWIFFLSLPPPLDPKTWPQDIWGQKKKSDGVPPPLKKSCVRHWIEYYAVCLS